MAKDKQQKAKDREKRVAQKKHAEAEKKRQQMKTEAAAPKTEAVKRPFSVNSAPKTGMVAANKKKSFTQRRSGG